MEKLATVLRKPLSDVKTRAGMLWINIRRVHRGVN